MLRIINKIFNIIHVKNIDSLITTVVKPYHILVNTIIIPSGRPMDEYTVDTLFEWVSQGGTLIAHNRSTRFLTSENGIGSVKQLQNTFDESEKYNFDLIREIYSQYENVDKDKTNNNIGCSRIYVII